MSQLAKAVTSDSTAQEPSASRATISLGARGTIGFVIVAVLLAFIEGAAYRWEGNWITLAAYTWVAWSVFAILAAIYFIAGALWEDLKARHWLSLICVAAAVICLSWGIGRPEYTIISNESAQEVGAGLANAKKSNLGYLETAFLGYPSRQYLLTAVPSLVAGRSWLNLHLGYLWLILTGLGMFYAGLRAALAKLDPSLIGYAGLVALAVYAFPYQLNFARLFEQVALPSAFVMIATGWFLLARARCTFVRLGALSWSGAMLAMSYSPGLAAWCLLLTLLAFWLVEAVRQNDRRLAVWVGAATIPLLSHGLLFYLLQAPRGPFSARSNLAVLDTVLGTIQNLFFNFIGEEWWGPPMAFFPVLLALPIVIYLLYSLSGSLGWTHGTIAFWSLGTIFTGVFLAGYTDYPIHFSIQRGNVVVPPLVAGMTLAGFQLLIRSGRRPPVPLARLLALLLVVNVAFNTQRSQANYQRMVYGLAGHFLKDIDNQMKENGLDSKVPVTFILLSSQYEINNPPFAEFAQYRFDDVKLITSDEEISPPGDPGWEGRAVLVYMDAGIDAPHLRQLLGNRTLRKASYVVRDRRMDLRRAVFPPGTFAKSVSPADPSAGNGQ